MFLRKIFSLRHTLAFRLTFWYWGIFTVSSFAAFLICYVLGTSGVSEYRDRSLLRELAEFSALLASKGMDDVKSAIVHATGSGGAGSSGTPTSRGPSWPVRFRRSSPVDTLRQASLRSLT